MINRATISSMAMIVRRPMRFLRWSKMTALGIAALFASGGVLVNPSGTHTDIAKVYDAAFKAGFNHHEVEVQSVSPLGADAALAIGTFHATGKSDSGAPLDVSSVWTATDVREGGVWKVRMLTGFPKPPPAK
jgi:Domain of unknown function (DUF4440)